MCRRNPNFWECVFTVRIRGRSHALPCAGCAIAELDPYIDWSPFFHAWELRGRYPAIFDDPKMGKQARELFDDAQELLERIAAKDLLIPRGVYAFWPANAVGDDVHVYADDARTEKIATFYFLRQQMQKPSGQFNHCLADYVAPESARPAQRSDATATIRIISADSRSQFMARMSLRRSSSVSMTTTARS